LTLSSLVFPFPFLGTGTGSVKFRSRISRREICSRKYVLGFREVREIYLSLSLSPLPLSLSRSLSLSISVSLSVCLSLFCSSVRLSIRPSFFLFLVSNFSFKTKVRHISSSRNSRRERELFLVPEHRRRDMFGNCFHENFGNWRDMTGKL
jgi:hypothetical protein